MVEGQFFILNTMKISTFPKFALLGLLLGSILSGCDSDNGNDEPSAIPNETWYIDFKDVPASLIGGPTAYGANLYYGATDQITTGYLKHLYENTYIQFPVNYGSTYDAEFKPVIGYSFYNGGIAVSNWYNKDEATYLNQLSSIAEPFDGQPNFIVAFGNSDVTDSSKATLADYDGCGKIYLTDEKGYTVANPGEENSKLSGNPKFGDFMSLKVTNTTYTYLTMLDGNDFTAPLEENKGWFKVQFILFDKNTPDARPIDYTEVYLANFDEEVFKEIGYEGIINEWIDVKLNNAKNQQACIMAINFVGSDMGEWGLNTPTYCAITGLSVSLDK